MLTLTEKDEVRRLFTILSRALTAKRGNKDAASADAIAALVTKGVQTWKTLGARNDLFASVESYVPLELKLLWKKKGVSPFSRVIGLWGGDRDVQDLEESFGASKSLPEKKEIIGALSTIGGTRAAMSLAKIAAETKEPMARVALMALENMASIESIEASEGGSMSVSRRAVESWERLRLSEENPIVKTLSGLEHLLSNVQATALRPLSMEIFHLLLTSAESQIDDQLYISKKAKDIRGLFLRGAAY